MLPVKERVWCTHQQACSHSTCRIGSSAQEVLASSPLRCYLVQMQHTNSWTTAGATVPKLTGSFIGNNHSKNWNYPRSQKCLDNQKCSWYSRVHSQANPQPGILHFYPAARWQSSQHEHHFPGTFSSAAQSSSAFSPVIQILPCSWKTHQHTTGTAALIASFHYHLRMPLSS